MPDASAHVLTVAIDGGAASGKSSTARALSVRFNFLHVDTGSHYRLVTERLLGLGVAADRPDEDLVRTLGGLRLETRVAGRSAVPLLDGREPGPEIRSERVNRAVSHYAARGPVRRFLRGYQRGQRQVAAASGLDGLVMEGRDIGSVIFPDADVRIFLTADEQTRERRRAAQGGEQDPIHLRDQVDRQRREAPMQCPPGATVVDTTHLGLEEVVARIAGLIEDARRRVQP